MSHWIIAFVVGVGGGLIGALCGVGGGIIMVPAFVIALQLDQKQAVATSLAVIVVTALSASANNVRNGFVDWRIFGATAAGAVLAALAGSQWMKSLQNETLTRIFAIVLIAVGIQMLFVKPGS